MHRRVKFTSRKLEKKRTEIAKGTDHGFWDVARGFVALLGGRGGVVGVAELGRVAPLSRGGWDY